MSQQSTFLSILSSIYQDAIKVTDIPELGPMPFDALTRDDLGRLYESAKAQITLKAQRLEQLEKFTFEQYHQQAVKLLSGWNEDIRKVWDFQNEQSEQIKKQFGPEPSLAKEEALDKLFEKLAEDEAAINSVKKKALEENSRELKRNFAETVQLINELNDLLLKFSEQVIKLVKRGGELNLTSINLDNN